MIGRQTWLSRLFLFGLPPAASCPSRSIRPKKKLRPVGLEPTWAPYPGRASRRRDINPLLCQLSYGRLAQPLNGISGRGSRKVLYHTCSGGRAPAEPRFAERGLGCELSFQHVARAPRPWVRSAKP